MKYISLICIFLSLLSPACSGGSYQIVGHESIVAAAERDAVVVIEAQPESMEQQGAVLEIKARENAMRDAGFDAEADLYIETVEHILVDSLHILPSCR